MILRGILLKVIYPLLMLVSSFKKDLRERLQAWVIARNNALIMRSGLRTKRLLLLLPHCIQVDKCDIRITHDIRNCKRCGRCGIKDLIGVSEKYGLVIHVATGGNLARRIVSDARPEAIVAVACERDLSSGIADVYPMPVYGICNERPEGPCLNTRVSIKQVEEVIERLVSGAA